MSEAPVGVSVVIAVHNEGDQVRDCVRSVAWADEILVVENDSTDDTLARAREAGATVFSHPFRTIAGQRNAAIARAQHRWILVVDADERGTEALGAEVARVIDASGGPAAYRVPRRNYFLGREVKHGGWERDRPVRLFRATLRYEELAVHEHVVVPGPVGTLSESLLHTPYADLDEYLEKLRRYARWWGEQNAARGRRASMADLLFRPPERVFTMLVLRSGWRDGAAGVVLALLAAVSVVAKYAHLWARQQRRETPVGA